MKNFTITPGICPICGQSISRTMLLCHDHWFMLPRHQRNRVNTAYRMWLDGKLTGDQLRQVQETAVKHLRESLDRK